MASIRPLLNCLEQLHLNLPTFVIIGPGIFYGSTFGLSPYLVIFPGSSQAHAYVHIVAKCKSFMHYFKFGYLVK